MPQSVIQLQQPAASTQPDPRRATMPLLQLQLHGSQAQMGRQHGELLAQAGGYRGIEYYKRMAPRLLATGLPPALRQPGVRRLLKWAVKQGRDRMTKNRPDMYRERSDAFFRALGESAHFGDGLFEMDAFQNLVTLLKASGQDRLAEAVSRALPPACTSLMAWGNATDTGRMLHARNFDFPGTGIWDVAPSVVFCSPDEGLRYGFVTTRGADVPGVTAFNEAGLSLTLHTRFHRSVRFNGWGVCDLGHEIVRTCRTLDDAINFTKKIRINSTWGLALSSAAEKRALIIETHANGIAVEEPAPGRNSLACANRYQMPEMQRGQLNLSAMFMDQSDGRHQIATQAGIDFENGIGADPQAMGLVLGGHYDPSSQSQRGPGSIISQAITVKSIVFDPDQEQVWIGTGSAPTGWGPYTAVKYNWDAKTSCKEITKENADDIIPATIPTLEHDPGAKAYYAYLDACRAELNAANRSTIAGHIQRAVDHAPNEPRYRLLQAGFQLHEGQWQAAADNLKFAVTHEDSEPRRETARLWYSRVLAATGQKKEARTQRQKLLESNHEFLDNARQQAKKDHRTPFPKWRLRHTTPDLMLVDLH